MSRILSYVSFRGRANRARFWLTNLALFGLLIGVALVGMILALIPVVGPVLGLLDVVLYLAVVVASFANGARRLHDRGKSAWWLLLFMGLPLLLSVPAELMRFGGGAEAQAGAAFFTLLGFPFSIWGFVVMGCLKGTVGPNRYGDDPLQPAAEEVFA